MAEKPFTIGAVSLLHTSANELIALSGDIRADVVVVTLATRDPSREFGAVRALAKDNGLLVGLHSRVLVVDAVTQPASGPESGCSVTHILRKTSASTGVPRTSPRTSDGGGIVRLDGLRDLFADIPDGSSVVSLTSCGGSLVTLGVERHFRLLCIEPDRNNFMCAVANVGRALNYDPIDALASSDRHDNR